MIITALNNSGSAIAAGEVVRKTGYSNTFSAPTIDLADATTQANSIFFGIADEAISDGVTGSVRIAGVFSPIDTSAFTGVGDKIFLSNTAGAISTTAGTVERIVGYVETIGISGSLFIVCVTPGNICRTTTTAAAAGTVDASTLAFVNMTAIGLLALAGTLPATNLGPDLIPFQTVLTAFRARRGTPGVGGTTTIQLEVDGVPQGGAILSWTPADPAFALKTVAIAKGVNVGARIGFRLISRETGSPRDIIAEANA